MMTVLPRRCGEDKVCVGIDASENVHTHSLSRYEAVPRVKIDWKSAPYRNTFVQETTRQFALQLFLRRPAYSVRRLPRVPAGDENYLANWYLRLHNG
jgi:hypothetical protein